VRARRRRIGQDAVGQRVAALIRRTPFREFKRYIGKHIFRTLNCANPVISR
jgi:hypothetical protein